MSSTNEIGSGSEYETLLKRAYAASSPLESQQVYSDWAKSYNAHLTDPSINYQGPKLVAEAAVKYLPSSRPLQVFDAGCGTGLVGINLLDLLRKDPDFSEKDLRLHGGDITPAMLEVASATKIYRNLVRVDLTAPLYKVGITEKMYDVIVCAGTLTEGHVGPVAIEEFVKATKPGGIIAATIHDKVWEAKGFKAEVDRLSQEGAVEVLELGAHTFFAGATTMSRVLVLKKSESN